jgi:site-specific recombinase XerD
MLDPQPFAALTRFDQDTTDLLREMLSARHVHLGQLDRPYAERSFTARNYDSSIKALGLYMGAIGEVLPTRSVLERWRDDMAAGRMDEKTFSVRTINARLAAVRKLLRAVADDVMDITIKLVLRDWAAVEDAKAIVVQDKIEEDYGRRFKLGALNELIKSIDVSNLKGLRDRALIAVMAGAGLRVSEVVNLTLRDMFATENEHGQRGIRVRRGKHNKSRIVVLSGWSGWVTQAVKAYTDMLGLSAQEHPNERVFRGLKRGKGGGYLSTGTSLSARKVQKAVSDYRTDYMGEMVHIACHDLRRTYAKLCKQSGMSWEALRENMGHSSVVITENYVGHDVDWSERIPNWSIKLD